MAENINDTIDFTSVDIEEFYDITIRSDTLVDYLIETIGTNGIDDGVCINIIKTGENFAS